MRKFSLLATTPAILGLAASPLAAQPQAIDINVGLIQGGSVCGASYKLGDNRKLEVRINAESGNVDVAVQNLPAELVNAGLERENVAITLIFNGQHRMTTDVGVFRAGFTYRAQGYWNDEDTGIEAIARLQDVQTLEVEIDGQSYGTATSRPTPDIGYNFILNCLG